MPLLACHIMPQCVLQILQRPKSVNCDQSSVQYRDANLVEGFPQAGGLGCLKIANDPTITTACTDVLSWRRQQPPCWLFDAKHIIVCKCSLPATCGTRKLQNVMCRNAHIAEMGGQVAPRPMSRERLPAMEGFKEGLAPEMSAQSEVMSM